MFQYFIFIHMRGKPVTSFAFLLFLFAQRLWLKYIIVTDPPSINMF